jgi:hypothetical protein
VAREFVFDFMCLNFIQPHRKPNWFNAQFARRNNVPKSGAEANWSDWLWHLIVTLNEGFKRTPRLSLGSRSARKPSDYLIDAVALAPHGVETHSLAVQGNSAL